MKLYIALTLALPTFLASFSAQAASGCLVRTKTKVVIDPACKCLETKSCAKQGKLQYSKKFFDAKNADGKAIFSAQEKAAYEKSYKLLNEINELKSQGKGSSAEIKKVYFELDKVNSEISILLHKNHPDFMAKQKKRYVEKSKQRKEQSLKREKAIKDFLAKEKNSLGAQQPALKPSQPVEQKPKSIVTQAPEAVVAPAQVPIKDAQAKTDTLSDDDKKEILRKLNKEKLEVTEEDSLFDIISKTYKGKAYQKLWEPKKLEDTPVEP